MSEINKFRLGFVSLFEFDILQDRFLRLCVEELVLRRKVIFVFVLPRHRIAASRHKAVDPQVSVGAVDMTFEIVVLREPRTKIIEKINKGSMISQQQNSPAVVAEKVFGPLVLHLDVHFELAVRVELFTAASNLAGDMWLGVDFHVSFEVERAVEEIPADLAGHVFDAVPLDLKIEIFLISRKFRKLKVLTCISISLTLKKVFPHKVHK